MHLPAPLDAPMTPIDALRRVCVLLERGRESSYRVDAFRRALAVAAALPDGELVDRARRGTLKELPSIGDASAGIIAEAVAGEVPAYLQKLEAKYAGPLTSGGDDLYAAVVGDLHLHSDWSDGGAPIDEMAQSALEWGHDWVALTDHSPRLKVARGLTAERLIEQIGFVTAIDQEMAGRLRFLTGIEVDILDDGSLDQRDDLLGVLDIVTASVHSKLKMAEPQMTRRMVRAVENPHTNVLGHCTGRLVTGGRGQRAQSAFDAHAVFSACAVNNVAVEINSRPERCDPPDELILLAAELGCLFAIDSDAHAPGQLGMKAYGCERAERLGIPADRIVTTWPVDRLLAWARSTT